eukprot:TRINITY_DN1575_c0_g1_i2.p2 TRINITY_DN1575_c0_g1~~TRINITY_DN1575_c0_g1_i2.p2  ORF type:complete len:137 (+),score=17.70 TRINITY_DN1575_c0_g1_i2:558-968(+)
MNWNLTKGACYFPEISGMPKVGTAAAEPGMTRTPTALTGLRVGTAGITSTPHAEPKEGMLSDMLAEIASTRAVLMHDLVCHDHAGRKVVRCVESSRNGVNDSQVVWCPWILWYLWIGPGSNFLDSSLVKKTLTLPS